MANLEDDILYALAHKNYRPLKPKALARKMAVPPSQYGEFRHALRTLAHEKRIEMARNHTVRPLAPHGTVAGIYRRTGTGTGFVRPQVVDGLAGPEILI